MGVVYKKGKNPPRKKTGGDANGVASGGAAGFIRSDLACESGGVSPSHNGGGYSFTERDEDGVTISALEIRDGEAARTLGKPEGCYITVNFGKVWLLDDGELDSIAGIISAEIRRLAGRMTGRAIDPGFRVLVAGLGNADITPDAIGPLTLRGINATRHIREYDREMYDKIGGCEISSFSPGVLGQTGIETVELIRGAVQNVTPDLVIAVDALVARSTDRLAATVQLSDAGINPGSGIGNHRKSISRETVGVPVLSVGVPTVVDSSTLVYDALERAGISEICDELQKVLENGRGFFVSPKESDVITHEVSALLSDSINRALSCSDL